VRRAACNGLGGAVVDGRWREQPDPGVAMDAVLVTEELSAEHTGLLDRVEPVGGPGPVLQRLEVRLGVRVVGRGVYGRL
jgi:hypothetical protein